MSVVTNDTVVIFALVPTAVQCRRGRSKSRDDGIIVWRGGGATDNIYIGCQIFPFAFQVPSVVRY